MTKKTDKLTLKPGILVSLKTAMRGGVEYKRKDLDVDAESAVKPACADCGGPVDRVTRAETDNELYRCPACGTERPADVSTEVKRWETTKVIADLDEHKKASRARSRCRSLISSVCSQSAFGLICTESKETSLDEAIAEARAMAANFNREAKTVQIAVYVLKGRIASTDEEAAKAIASELRELLDEMKDGIGVGNIEAAREAARKALNMGSMLDETAGKKVNAAISEVREAAKLITKRMQSGETAATIVRDIRLDALERARFAFIDLDDAEPIEPLPSTTKRSIDLDDAEPRNAGVDA